MAHEAEKAQYEEDALWHPRPWELYEEWVWENGYRWRTLMNEPFFKDFEPILWKNNYRRKPGAPKKNCAMCKHRTNHHPNDCPLDPNYRDIKFYVVNNGNGCPDWCLLDQPKEEPARPAVAAIEKALADLNKLYVAAEDILVWLESFGLTRGSDNVKALRNALEEVRGK